MIVLDSSCVLAYAFNEPGADLVEPGLAEAFVPVPNWAEVHEHLRRRGFPAQRTTARVLAVGTRPISVDRDDAELAASLWEPGNGLSLADRFCIAVGRRLDLPVWTCDRAWAGVDPRVVVLR
ncbi:MAG: type II toxin-antitoxin system VapC family toxin [Actinobacteria bacterium]|nr:type II toxin-antitoxin system VapC family toxin [Actinomycetota bacterium]